MSPTINEASAYLQGLDLTYLVDTMCSDIYPLPRWEKNKAQDCMNRYKNFLFLFKKYPGETFVPTKEIDECWHNHILFTKNYHHDCLHIFGFYLHHEPINPNENSKDLIHDYLRTKQIYQETFNESIMLSN